MYSVVKPIAWSVQCIGFLDAKQFATTSAHTIQATTSGPKKKKTINIKIFEDISDYPKDKQ